MLFNMSSVSQEAAQLQVHDSANCFESVKTSIS